MSFAWYKGKPLLDLMDKETNFTGNESYPIPITRANPAGGSASPVDPYSVYSVGSLPYQPSAESSYPYQGAGQDVSAYA